MEGNYVVRRETLFCARGARAQCGSVFEWFVVRVLCVCARCTCTAVVEIKQAAVQLCLCARSRLLSYVLVLIALFFFFFFHPLLDASSRHWCIPANERRCSRRVYRVLLSCQCDRWQFVQVHHYNGNFNVYTGTQLSKSECVDCSFC